MNSTSRTSCLDSPSPAATDRAPHFSSRPVPQDAPTSCRPKAGHPIQDQDTARGAASTVNTAPNRRVERPSGQVEKAPKTALMLANTGFVRGIQPVTHPFTRCSVTLKMGIGTPAANECAAKGAAGNWEVFHRVAKARQPPAKEGGSRRVTKRWGWGITRLDKSRDRFAGHQPAWRAAPVPTGRCQSNEAKRRPCK